MFKFLEELCNIPAASGGEKPVRDYIYSKIKGYADCKIDNMGNLIAFKKGNKPSGEKMLMTCAHMDEVGFIITAIDDDGFLSFTTVGGILPSAIIGSRVQIGNITGVIGAKAVHLMDSDERDKLPKTDELYIDIGAENKKDAEKYVRLGDYATFERGYVNFGDGFIKAPAIDDRAGCAMMMDIIINQTLEYDRYFVFTVQEEVGCRGAAAAAFGVKPYAALVLESTTAADIADTPSEKEVCRLGDGGVLSFMDGGTIYNRGFYSAAIGLAERNNIKYQIKSAVAGGNDSSAIHKAVGGVKTLALSLSCRYLHTKSCVIKANDMQAAYELCLAVINSQCYDTAD